MPRLGRGEGASSRGRRHPAACASPRGHRAARHARSSCSCSTPGPTPMPRARVRAARARAVERLGVVERGAGRGARARPVVPHDELLVASDRSAAGEDARADHVAGVHRPSLMLSHLTVGRPSGRRSTSAPAAGSRRSSRRGTAGASSRRTSTRARSSSRLSTRSSTGSRTSSCAQGSFFEPVEGSASDS